MKIALITNSYKSPTELWIWRQVDFLREIIGYVGVLEQIYEQKEDNFPVVSLLDENPQIALNPFFLSRKLYVLEKQYNIDAYYIYFLTNAYLLKDYISLTDKKVFVHCHGYDLTWDLKHHQNPWKNYHSQEYISFTSNMQNQIVFITDSEHAKLQLILRGIDENRIRVLYFGVPIEGVNQSKNDELIKILFLGRFVDFKGPDLTILAFERLCNKGINAELIMAGDGPLMTTCQLLKRRSQFSEKIKLLGTVSYEIARSLRNECHIFTAHNIKGCLSNQEEAYGVSIIEAMGAGLPVVTGKNGGVKETVIHNVTGFLFDPGDIELHSRYLTELAGDNLKRQKMGYMALSHVVKNFTLAREKSELLKIVTAR